MPVRCARRPGRGVLLLGAAARRASATSSRGLCSTASISSSPCPAPARGSSEARRASRRRRCGRVSRRPGHGCGASRVRLTREADELLARAVERLPLSGRGRARVARVAQTAAALAGAERAGAEHVAEALSYRAPSELVTR